MVVSIVDAYLPDRITRIYYFKYWADFERREFKGI